MQNAPLPGTVVYWANLNSHSGYHRYTGTVVALKAPAPKGCVYVRSQRMVIAMPVQRLTVVSGG